MNKKVLIVDDHDDFRATLKDYLDQHHLALEVIEANSGQRGVIKASKIKPDIVVMDIDGPNEYGFKAARQIKEDHPRCDIIILTLFDEAIIKKDAERIKVRAIISKNDVFEKLLPAIKECLHED